MCRLAALAVFVGVLATVYVAACVLPGEPSGAERIQFALASPSPYRVPLAGIVEPLIAISANGHVLTNPSYRLETLDADVVRVDSTERRLLGVVRGTAAVRVTYLGATGTPDTVFSVQVVVSRVAMDSPTLAFSRLGGRTRLNAIALDAHNAAVPNVVFAWSSSDPTVVMVNDTGLVTAVNEGVASITAEADGVVDSSNVSVTQVAAAVRVGPELDTLRTVGRSIQFLALAFDSSNNVLLTARPHWTSSDTTVARVDSVGRATATGAGTGRIIARVGAAADTATLVVAQVVRLLAVTPGFDTLKAIAETARVVAVAFDSLNFPIPNPGVAWATSDTAVVTVDQMGLVRAARNGVVLVTASARGQSAFATIAVRQEVATARIVQDSAALAGAGDTVRLSAVGLDRNGYPVAGAAFAWRSGLLCVATVDTGGLVTAGGEGSVPIIATLANSGQSDTAMVSVGGAPSACRHAIAFVSTRDGNYEIYVMDADGSTPINLTNDPGGNLAPVWSPDGTRIAFVSYRDGNPEIYVMGADGSGPQNLTNNPSNDYLHVWSPDGTKIAFMSDRDGNGEIYVMNADGSGLVNLTSYSGADEAPAWSPDGTRIAFSSARDGYYGIYVMNPDGSGLVALTGYPGPDHAPVWSPDGAKIAFYRHHLEDGGSDIWLMNADGSGQRNLTNTPGAASIDAPVWSPDGTKIAFHRFPDIYVVNADGSGLLNVTNNPSANYWPVWSSDGTKIAFWSYRDGNAEVYVMNADGSGPTNLSNNPSIDYAPVWRRR